MWSIIVRISLYTVKIQGFALCLPHSVRNIWNKKLQVFAYFSVLVFALDSFVEIKLLSTEYNYQSRINISMYASTEDNIALQLTTKAGIQGQYHVLCSNNIQLYKIFLSNSTFSNLRYTHLVLYKVIQTFYIQNGFDKSFYKSILLIPDRLLKLSTVLSL